MRSDLERHSESLRLPGVGLWHAKQKFAAAGIVVVVIAESMGWFSISPGPTDGGAKEANPMHAVFLVLALFAGPITQVPDEVGPELQDEATEVEPVTVNETVRVLTNDGDSPDGVLPMSAELLGVLILGALTVVGWGISYHLTIKAQGKLLYHQILNEARITTTVALREEQARMQTISSKILDIRLWVHLGETRVLRVQEGEPDRTQEWHRAFFAPPSGWAKRLEEHEILFPETREVRMELVERLNSLTRRLGELLSIARRHNRRTDKPHEVVRLCDESVKSAHDVIALMHDLILHLQNATLKDITGNDVPPRTPEDPSAPRIAMGRDGKLRINSDELT